MPQNLEQLIEEIEIINAQIDEQAQEEDFLGTLDTNGREKFNNMQIAFKDMESRFTNSVPYLIPESKINNSNIANGINWIKSGLKAPNSYNNYTTADNFAKGFAFLANLASTMPLPVAESSDRLKDAARSLFASIGQYQGRYDRNLEVLETKKDQLDKAIDDLDDKKGLIKRQWDELEKSINEKQQSLDQQYSQLHSDFINNQSDRATTFENSIQELEREKSNLLHQIKVDFDEEKTNYIEEVKEEKEDVLEKLENDFQEWYDNLKANFNDWKEEINKEHEEIMTDLHKKQNEAAEIVGNVANNGIAGHFAKEAKAKTISVWVWRISTITAFLITVFAGFQLLIEQVGSNNNAMNITELISRLVVTAALGSLTAYLSKLASNDEKSREYNSSMEIRLRTLNPYLDAFDSEERTRLKKELFPVIFRESEKDYQGSKEQLRNNEEY